MHREPFEILGVSKSAPRREIRAAFRMRARRLHPDHNPGCPHAEERFKELVSAYERALGRRPFVRRRRARNAATAAPRPLFRYECLRCGDSFAMPEACPQCEETLWDRQGPRPAQPPIDPRILDLVRELETAPRTKPSLPIAPPLRPAIASLGFLLFGASVVSVGLPALGVMLAGYGALVAGYGLHARAATRPMQTVRPVP